MVAAKSDLEQYFVLLEESIVTLQQALDSTFLAALIETGDNLANQGRIQVENNQPDEATRQKLNDLYSQLFSLNVSVDVKRKAMQLALLKASQSETPKPNQQMTPDAIGYLISFLAETFGTFATENTVIDLAVGTGNLLATVLIALNQQNKQQSFVGVGVDNDETQLSISAMLVRYLGLLVTLYHQDALDGLHSKPANLAVADLPIGYYPIDERAAAFETHSEQGHSYAHHLLIEQSMNAIVPDGIGIFIVPSSFFDSEEAPNFLSWATKGHFLQGFLNLPTNLFGQAKEQKSLLIVQNKGEHSHQVKQVLGGNIPDLKDTAKMQDFTKQVTAWAVSNQLK